MALIAAGWLLPAPAVNPRAVESGFPLPYPERSPISITRQRHACPVPFVQSTRRVSSSQQVADTHFPNDFNGLDSKQDDRDRCPTHSLLPILDLSRSAPSFTHRSLANSQTGAASARRGR